jgi:hypothetical protein
METILRGLVASSHPEGLKEVLFKKVKNDLSRL